MKALYFSTLLLTCFFNVSCGGAGSSANSDIDSSLVLKDPANDTFQKAQIINPVICRDDPTKSYALYIPKVNDDKPLPIIYFFDPHGDGSLPVKKYKALADSFHFILAGSNDSKNGNNFTAAANIFEVMNADVQKRVAVNDNRIYLCGFSGGAKVATYLALHFPGIKGVIANGAGLEEITTAGNFKFSFTAITGNGDMNMTDLVAIDNILDRTSTRHRIIFFDGIHEWAPENTMSTAFEGFQLDAMSNNLIKKDNIFINRFVSKNGKKINDAEKKNDLLQAEEICRFCTSVLDNLADESAWFHKKEDSIMHTSAYQKQEALKQNLLQKEENTKAVFQQNFQIGDKNYWDKTIAGLKLKARGKTPEAAMYQRLQAYLSLAFYSISNQLIHQNQNKDAGHFVSLYKTADPTNSEAWYFSAILDARNDNSKSTTDDLLKAVSLGFNDKKRLTQQPEFSNSRVTINLAEIEKKMK
jgi:predicted esterase